MKSPNDRRANLLRGVVCIAIVAAGLSVCRADPPATISPALQEVIKLSQAHVSDDNIITYINNSSTWFDLTADDLVYLKSQGVTEPVISALQKAKPDGQTPAPSPGTPPAAPPPPPQPGGQPPPPPDAGTPPAPEMNFNYFHDQLAPFGTWVEVDGAQYWRPDAALRTNPDWRPYYDMGQWVDTDNGLFWQSDYTWGDIPFHYGRWVSRPGMGWLWAPDYTWGPAWVFWRHAEADGAIGWAPLPVGAEFVDGGFLFRGARVGLDFDFGLGEGVFTFVDFNHFHEGFFRMRGREYAYHIHGDRFHDFYRRSVIRNDFRRDEHGRFVNNGIGHDRIMAATHGRLAQSKFEERQAVGDRNKLAEVRRTTGGSAAAAHPTSGGEKPAAAGKATVAQTPSKVFRPPTTTTTKTTTKSTSSSNNSNNNNNKKK